MKKTFWGLTLQAPPFWHCPWQLFRSVGEKQGFILRWISITHYCMQLQSGNVLVPLRVKFSRTQSDAKADMQTVTRAGSETELQRKKWFKCSLFKVWDDVLLLLTWSSFKWSIERGVGDGKWSWSPAFLAQSLLFHLRNNVIVLQQ